MNKQINPNLAEAEDLTGIAGIGPKLAERIVAARPFSSLDDMQRVQGIGPSNLAQWRDELTLDDTPPPSFSMQEVQEDEADSLRLEEPIEAEDAIPPVEMGLELQETPSISEEEETETEPESLPEPAPTEIPVTEKTKEPFSREQILLIAGGGSILAFILALALMFGVLAGLNQGRLRFASPAEVNTLSLSVDTLTSRLDTQESDLQALRARIDALETLSERMTAAEENIDTLTTDVNALTTDIDGLKEDVSGLNSDVEQLQTQTTLFATFFDSMRDLFNQFFPAQGGSND